jgi:hypothetical protein
MMGFDWLISLRPFLLLVVAIPTGLFVRTVGELFVTWAKKPTEDAKKAKEKRARLLALRASLGNASQYCKQMAEYLKGVPLGNDTVDEKLKEAAIQAGRMLTIPTFNLDMSVLNEQATVVYELLSEDKAQKIQTTRLELAHVHRRIDTIADRMLLMPSLNQFGPHHIVFIAGASQLLESTIKHCESSSEVLRQEIEAIPERTTTNWRPILVILAMLLFVGGLYWIAKIPTTSERSGDATKKEQLEQQQQKNEDREPSNSK